MKKIYTAFAFFVMSVTTAFADNATIVSNYLSTLKSVKGDFVQIGPDGATANGKFAIKRPGKMNFQYAPPTPLRVTSDGFWVAVEDSKLKTRDRYPLDETPLILLVDENVNLSKSKYVKSITDNGDSIHVNAYDPNNKEHGEIKFIFTKNPVELRQWIVTDAQGLKTTLNILNMSKDVNLDNRLFYIEND
jgi:outer membrane lipoprotein-sorting protein